MKKQKMVKNKTLTLSLKKEWFDMINSGVKTEEYRIIKDFWIRRLLCITHNYVDANDFQIEDVVYAWDDEGKLPEGIYFEEYDKVTFTLGYPRKDETDKHMSFEIKEITIGYGNTEWGAPIDSEVFIIKLGNRIVDDI